MSALFWPPGAPSHGPGGSGAPGAMRGQGRKESLSESRDLDGSYDQLTGESVIVQGSWEGEHTPISLTLAWPLYTLCPIPMHLQASLGSKTLGFKAWGS